MCGKARKNSKKEQEQEPKLLKAIANTLDIYIKKKKNSVTMDSKKKISHALFLDVIIHCHSETH